jgi:hypothetical protein
MDRASIERSVRALLNVANSYSGGSKPAALVLLSAYNSYEFTIPVNELCVLDPNNYQHAINVITARYHGTEPHEVIDDGAAIFDELWNNWKHLSLNEAA